MRPLLRVLVLVSVMSLTLILPRSAPAQTRVELQRQVTDLNIRVDRLLELNEGFALGWQQREQQLLELQEQMRRLQGENAELRSRVAAQERQLTRELANVRTYKSANPFQPYPLESEQKSTRAATPRSPAIPASSRPSAGSSRYPRPPPITFHGRW